MKTNPRRARRSLTVVALALTLVSFPLGALASHDFLDVPDSNAFHADISALAASGVTTGCGGGNYCPSAFVTREQMAAFMNRLGALGPGKTPVVNAAELGGLDSTAFALAGHSHQGAHTQVQWDFTVEANTNPFGSTHVIGTTTMPAGSWLEAYALSVDDLSNVPADCSYVNLLLRLEPFDGYIYGWERIGVGDPTPYLLPTSSPDRHYVAVDSTLQLDVYCLNVGLGSAYGTPAITGRILLEWTPPPTVIQ